MKHAHLVVIVLSAALATACASRPVKTETPENAPTTRTAPARESPKREAPKEVIKEAPVESEVVGKPAPGSKFAKLKTGMSLNQVEKLIGPPTKRWTHPTGKASIPFYFGPDRWVIQYAYKSEGVLTFNSGGEQLLTRIEVNKGE
ncbi:hypothetical protein [Sideroxydans lithotrophicus]|uniref:Lipoprotein SmpA/OmlA domain-containing protein n=1 Tax=Sideroxydans lithotrophicus (strain ES-1) TaxID=580332 RepID=D5CLM3_SIDLE|nr:hypothetical protein [Sideroxydans lithotrophicus]ADE10611.1 hypothetical protein Slit_0369 [Sideroxydans lithotrophicus ES-1]